MFVRLTRADIRRSLNFFSAGGRAGKPIFAIIRVLLTALLHLPCSIYTKSDKIFR